MYHEFAVGYSVMSAQSLTCWTQPASAVAVSPNGQQYARGGEMNVWLVPPG